MDETIKALTFASHSKKWAANLKSGHGSPIRPEAEKFFESLEATARKSSIYGKVYVSEINSIKDVNFRKEIKVRASKLIYNGEFDPGSG